MTMPAAATATWVAAEDAEGGLLAEAGAAVGGGGAGRGRTGTALLRPATEGGAAVDGLEDEAAAAKGDRHRTSSAEGALERSGGAVVGDAFAGEGGRVGSVGVVAGVRAEVAGREVAGADLIQKR